MAFLTRKSVKLIKTLAVGPFVYRFYFDEKNVTNSYVSISSEGCEFKLHANWLAYGYLLETARQDRIEQLHGYAVILYTLSTTIMFDQELADDITNAIVRWQDRIETKSRESAESADDKTIQADEAFMRDIIEYANKTPEQRKEDDKAHKLMARELLAKLSQEDSGQDN
jgi:hypothetical protein